LAESKAANKDGNAGKQTVEEDERAHGKRTSGNSLLFAGIAEDACTDPACYQLPHTCRDIPSAPFAGDDKLFRLQDWEPTTH